MYKYAKGYIQIKDEKKDIKINNVFKTCAYCFYAIALFIVVYGLFWSCAVHNNIKTKPINSAKECRYRLLVPMLGDNENTVKNTCAYNKGIWNCECNGMKYRLSETGVFLEAL